MLKLLQNKREFLQTKNIRLEHAAISRNNNEFENAKCLPSVFDIVIDRSEHNSLVIILFGKQNRYIACKLSKKYYCNCNCNYMYDNIYSNEWSCKKEMG